jgi:hypothetical protein
MAININNVSNAAVTPQELQTASAAQLVNTLPQEALYAEALQPLIAAVNPSFQYAFSPNPAPYSLSASAADLLATPSAFATTVSGIGGLDGALDSIGQDVTTAEANYTALLSDPNASQADLQKAALAYQKALSRFQAITQFMSQLENIKLKLSEDVIRNLKA